MKVWGWLAKVQIPLPKRMGVGPKTVDCIYIGHAENSVAYRFLVHKSGNADVKVNTIIESNVTEFYEDLFPYKEPKSTKTKWVYDDNRNASLQRFKKKKWNQAEVKEQWFQKTLVLILWRT